MSRRVDRMEVVTVMEPLSMSCPSATAIQTAPARSGIGDATELGRNPTNPQRDELGRLSKSISAGVFAQRHDKARSAILA
jgi:hypothetical protein